MSLPSSPPVPVDSLETKLGPRFAEESEISSHLLDEIPNNSGLDLKFYFEPSSKEICVFSVEEIDKYNDLMVN